MARMHPGKTLQDQYLKPNKLSQNQLARALGVPPRRINEIILGKRAITADTAVRLGYYFGNSAGYWMHLQAEFEIEQARTKIGIRLHNIRAPHKDEEILKSGKAVAASIEPTTTTKRNIKRRMMR